MTLLKSISTLDYASARVRARRARLLSRDEYDALLVASTLDDVIDFLDTTKYHNLLVSHALLAEGAQLIGRATGEFLRNEYLFCQRFYTKRQEVSLVALSGFLDVGDFLTVVRGKYAGVSEREIVETFMGPGLCITREALLTLARQESLDDVVSAAMTLHVPFVEALKRGVERFALSQQLSDLEIDVLHAFYRWELALVQHQSPSKTPIASYLRGRIDAQNIMTLARFISERSELTEDFSLLSYFQEGGEVIAHALKFMRLSEARSLDELAERINDAHLASVMRAQMAEVTLSASLSQLDTALYDDLTARAIGVGKRQIDNVGVSVAYLLALEREVKNVRLIARAKAFGIEMSMVKKALVGV